MSKFYGCVLMAGALVMSGCGKEQPQASPPPSAATASPNKDGYLGAMARGQQVAVKQIDTASLNQEIQLFNVQEGRNPRDLNELVTKNYIGKLPEPPAGMKINYDPVAGKVSVVPK